MKIHLVDFGWLWASWALGIVAVFADVGWTLEFKLLKHYSCFGIITEGIFLKAIDTLLVEMVGTVSIIHHLNQRKHIQDFGVVDCFQEIHQILFGRLKDRSWHTQRTGELDHLRLALSFSLNQEDAQAELRMVVHDEVVSSYRHGRFCIGNSFAATSLYFFIDSRELGYYVLPMN